MAVGSAQATAMLGALPGTVYVQVHNGDPGANGTANVIAGPSRGTVVLPAASGGQRSASGSVDCPGVPAGASVSWVSYWDAVSGGNFLASEWLGVSVSFAYAGTLRFLSQVFTVITAAATSQTQTSANSDTLSIGDSNVAQAVAAHLDTLTIADSNVATLKVAVSDAVAIADSNATRHDIVVTDAVTLASDSTGAAVGILVSVTDTLSAAADSNTAILEVAVTDTVTLTDSDAAILSVVVSDTITAVSDSNTASNVAPGFTDSFGSDSSASYTRTATASGDASTFLIGSGVLYRSPGSFPGVWTACYFTRTGATADSGTFSGSIYMDTTVAAKLAAGTFLPGLVIKFIDVNNFCTARITSTGISFTKVVAGTPTGLGSYSFTPAGGVTYKFQIDFTATTAKVWLQIVGTDGSLVQRIPSSGTVTIPSGAGMVGAEDVRSDNAGNPIGQVFWDDFVLA